MNYKEKAAGRQELLAAIIAGRARWEPFGSQRTDGEVCVGGLRYTTALDEDGCPVMTQHIRMALRKEQATCPR